MNILKKNNLKNQLLENKINIRKNNIVKGEFLTKVNSYPIIEGNNGVTYIYPKNIIINDNIFFFNKKEYGNNVIKTFIKPKNFYELYSKHFFNFIKKKKIKFIKGRVLNYNKKKRIMRIGTNGLIIKINKQYLTPNARKVYSKKKWKSLFSFYNMTKLFYFCTRIEINKKKLEKITKKKLKLKISRKKILKFINISNATV